MFKQLKLFISDYGALGYGLILLVAVGVICMLIRLKLLFEVI